MAASSSSRARQPQPQPQRHASSASSSSSSSTFSANHDGADVDGEDDDDAWALESDDDDFAVRQRVGSISLRGPAAGNDAASNGSQPQRRHAPPARPHPFPLPSGPASSNTSASTPSGWTIVSDSHEQRTRSGSAGQQPLAGSPPTDVGSTAAEAILDASLRDQQQPAPLSSSSASAAPASAITTTAALDKKRDKEAEGFLADVRPRVLDIVRDPFVALETVFAAERANAAADGPSTPLTSSVTPTPTTALQRQAAHTQNLGRARGFDELRTPAPNTPQQQRDFDAVNMARADGLIIIGSGWGSSSLNVSNGGSGGDNDKGQMRNHEAGTHQHTPYPAAGQSESDVGGQEGGSGSSQGAAADSATGGLRRSQSVRTRRRWREFFRCLGTEAAGTSTSTAGPSFLSTTTTSSSSSSSRPDGGVDLAKLRELSWNGIPTELRPIVWPLLLGYLPSHSSVRSATLARKRQEYCKAVQLAFGYDPFREGGAGTDGGGGGDRRGAAAASSSSSSSSSRSDDDGARHTPLAGRRRGSEEEKIWHQISIDVPRTNPGLPLWQRSSTQRCLERLLYVWAIRHHATGYVQGMSDLATPFFQVFLSAYVTQRTPSTVERYDVGALPLAARVAIEADTYFCLGKLLDGIQENYIFAQPGIQRQVRRMEELVGRIDAPLHAHLKHHGVEYMQFAFRWMNCLLMREMSVRNVTRLWDTYLAEGPDAFSDFHLYVCSVFLCKWSEVLRGLDFQGCIMFLQSLPTQGWSDGDAELLLSEAFVFKNLFGQTRHLGD